MGTRTFFTISKKRIGAFLAQDSGMVGAFSIQAPFEYRKHGINNTLVVLVS